MPDWCGLVLLWGSCEAFCGCSCLGGGRGPSGGGAGVSLAGLSGVSGLRSAGLVVFVGLFLGGGSVAGWLSVRGARWCWGPLGGCALLRIRFGCLVGACPVPLGGGVSVGACCCLCACSGGAGVVGGELSLVWRPCSLEASVL